METRDAKHEPRTLTEQRAAWHAQAAEVLGGPDAVQAMVSNALNPISIDEPAGRRGVGDGDRGDGCWRRWRNAVRPGRSGMSAPKRNARSGPYRFPPTRLSSWSSCSSTEVLQTRSVSLARPRRRHHRAGGAAAVRRFECLHRRRIRAVHLRPGSWPPSSDSSQPRAAPTAASSTPARSSWRCWNQPPTGHALDAGQAALVRAMCTSGARLQLAIAPAGAGKTTAMRTLARAWTRQRRPRDRAGPVGRRGRATPRPHRRTSRHAGQTHLVHPPQRPARLGGTHRPVHVGDHRRSRDGRHPLPGHRRPVHRRPRRQCSAGR